MTDETPQLWIKQAELDDGKRRAGLASNDQEKLRRLIASL